MLPAVPVLIPNCAIARLAPSKEYSTGLGCSNPSHLPPTMSGLLGTIEGLGNTVALKGKSMLDSFFPPEKRSELLAKLQSFAVRNPKLSAFLLTNFALTGPPLFLFVLFSLTVFVFALVVALLVGLLVAVGFTVFAVVLALLVLFPVTFFTTLAASFLFLWGLGGYYIFKWFNRGDKPAPDGAAVGDKLNALTGGRLDFVMGNARQKQIEGDKANGSPQANGKPKANGTPAKMPGGMGVNDLKKHADISKHAEMVKKNANVGNATSKINDAASIDGATKATGVDNVTKMGGIDGVTSKAGNVTGTAKGLVGGLG